MSSFLVLSLLLAAGGPPAFVRHEVDANYPGGYQVAVADLNGDNRPDLLALSTQADRVDWYENPSWQPHSIARTPKNIDLAVHDLDGDGRPEIAVASGFYFEDSQRGGQIAWLRQPTQGETLWPPHPIATDPVVHRLRWGDLDGDGDGELVHASLFSVGSKGPQNPRPAHLWAFRVPEKPETEPWQPWTIDETLTVLHGIWVGDFDGDGRAEIFTASFEGICRFDWEGVHDQASWRKVLIAPGGEPVTTEPGAARGTSEIAPGTLAADGGFLAAVEPWHGHQVVVYQAAQSGRWQRALLDGTLREAHALVVADLDADGTDELVVGWRGDGGGLALYDRDELGQWRKALLDTSIAVEGAVAADLNGDGRLDLAAIGGRTQNLLWYENHTR